ncbi:MAG: right-handed parallel beta-helix repeat-containing protein [Planctomycetota bacterium]
MPRLRESVCLVILLAASASGESLYVDASHSRCPGSGTIDDPFCQIQPAIDAAIDGDEVLVLPGTYTENLDFLGKAIRVHSLAGPRATIIDGGGVRSVVRFASGEGPGSVLEGFTLTRGSGEPSSFGPPSGGGIVCRDASPTIRGNTIEGNACPGGVGGGILLVGSVALVENNVIRDNRAEHGAGIYLSASTARVRRNWITANVATPLSDQGSASGGGLESDLGSACWAESNVIAKNRVRASVSATGGGVRSASPADRIVGNLIVHNRVTGLNARGGGAYVLHGWLVNNTILDNELEGPTYGGGGVRLLNEALMINSIVRGNWPDQAWRDLATRVTYCNVEGGTRGDGIIDADPGFLAAGESDYRLDCSSPCIDAGVRIPELPALDLEGDMRIVDGDSDGTAQPDLGADEFDLLWQLIGSPTPGGPDVRLRAQSPPAFAGSTGLVFLSFSNGVQTGGIPLPGCSENVPLDSDSLFRQWLATPPRFRQVSLGGCPGPETAAVTIPSNVPIGIVIYFAGVALGPDSLCSNVTPSRSFLTR